MHRTPSLTEAELNSLRQLNTCMVANAKMENDTNDETKPKE